MKEDVFSGNILDEAEQSAPLFYRTLKDNGFESAMVAKMRKRDRVCGYLVCAVSRSMRIWQENECALLYYLAGLLAEETAG